MTAIGDALGVQLPPCGSSSDENVVAHATRVRSGGSRHSGARGSRRDPALKTLPVAGSAAQ